MSGGYVGRPSGRNGPAGAGPLEAKFGQKQNFATTFQLKVPH